MNLVSSLPEYKKPLNVGLLFFNSNPEKFFPYTQIDVVQLPEGAGGDKIIEQTFKGPLHEQLRGALRYIRNGILTEKVIKHPDRAEADRYFNWPYAAIEEALSNAVYHKGYDEREPIEVRVENDRIEIISHPGPDRSVTQKDLKKYKVKCRRYRNRRIGDFLKELHLTEGRNTGFKKILDAMKSNESPLPEFETDKDRSYFISRLPIHKEFLAPKMAPKGDPQKTDIDSQIIALIEKDHRISKQKMSDELAVSLNTVKRNIRELIKSGRIVYEGSSKSGTWKVIGNGGEQGDSN